MRNALRNLSEDYVELSNRVLAVNYYGELVTAELIARLISRGKLYGYRDLLARQLLDETRHANVTRELSRLRGRDPLREDSRVEFTFLELFRDFSQRTDEEILAFLGENEIVSSRNFSQLIRIADGRGDTPLVGLYSEILNDEVTHSTSILSRLPINDPHIESVRAEARARMKKAFNWHYARLLLAFSPAAAAVQGEDGQQP